MNPVAEGPREHDSPDHLAPLPHCRDAVENPSHVQDEVPRRELGRLRSSDAATSTLWLSPEAIATWRPVGVGTCGGQQQYSDVAIETALTLRLLFHLPLRQAEGF